MFRKLNRRIQDFLREKRLKIGKFLFDRKNKIKIIEGNFIEKNKIKSILFLRYDGKIGDTVINTLMFREIKKKFSNVKIGVVTRKSNYAIIRDNPYISKKYIYEKRICSLLKTAQNIRHEHYDLLIDFSDMVRVKQMMFINLCKCKFNLGYQKDNWNLFDISFSNPKENFHISELYREVLKKLGIDNPDLNYDLYFLSSTKKKIQNLIEKYAGREIYILNPYAASKHRELNEKNIISIINMILKNKNRVIFIIGEEKNKEKINKIIKTYPKDVVYAELHDIMEVAYLIKVSNFVITPDTSIVHIAACFKKPMLAIYRLDVDKDNNSQLWSPNYLEANVIYSIDTKVKLGEETDINSFDLKEVESILNKKKVEVE